MFLKRLSFGVCLLSASFLSAFSQEEAAETAPNNAQKSIMVLDASGSMWGQIDGVSKIEIARDVIGNVLDEWPQTVDLGLMAYGHRRQADCTDIELVSNVAPLEKDAFLQKVNRIKPRGKTPISASLKEAAGYVAHDKNKSSVILVSDGLETCGFNPCDVASELEASGVDFTIHVVGFGVTEEESKQLQCIADNTGGKYLGADNASDLTLALSETVAAVAESEPPIPAEEPNGQTDIPNSIASLDLDDLAFDVQTFGRDAETGKIVATGTSNGVGWRVEASSIYQPLTNMDGKSKFNDLPGDYDDLHVGSNFTITFDQPVTSVLFTLANDNDTGDGPNFVGINPVDFVDASNPDGGSQVRIEDRGGALFYYFAEGEITTLSHVNDNGINDGFDLAFFVFPKAEQ